MPKYVFDTRLMISPNYDPYQLPETTCLSSVVYYEFMNTCKDRNERQAYGLAWRNMEEAGLLVIPSDEDMIEANRISAELIRECIHPSGDKVAKLSAKVKQEIALDCLLAVTAAREGVIILALHEQDFDYIKPYCKNLRVQEYPKI